MLIKEVSEQPGALLPLQYALTELYERRQGPALTLDDYRASVSGALARTRLTRELTAEECTVYRHTLVGAVLALRACASTPGASPMLAPSR